MDKLQKRLDRTIISEIAKDSQTGQENYHIAYSVIPRESNRFYNNKSIKIKKTIIKFD